MKPSGFEIEFLRQSHPKNKGEVEATAKLFSSCVENQKFEDASTIIFHQCLVGNVPAAELMVKACTEDVIDLLNLENIASHFIHSCRFEEASEVILAFHLLDRGCFDLLQQFFSALLTNSKYSLAVEWARTLSNWELDRDQRLPEYLRWTPAALVSAMIVAKDYADALKFIVELGLIEHFATSDIFERVLESKNFAAAIQAAKKINSESVFPSSRILKHIALAREWELAMRFAAEAQIPSDDVVRMMIVACDWESAIKYAGKLGQLPTGTADVSDRAIAPLTLELIEGMISSSNLDFAMKTVLRYDLQSQFSTEELIQKMIDLNQLANALRYMRELKMELIFQDQLPRICLKRLMILKSFRDRVQRRRVSLGLSSDSSSVDGRIISVKRWKIVSEGQLVDEILPWPEEPKDEAQSNSFLGEGDPILSDEAIPETDTNQDSLPPKRIDSSDSEILLSTEGKLVNDYVASLFSLIESEDDCEVDRPQEDVLEPRGMQVVDVKSSEEFVKQVSDISKPVFKNLESSPVAKANVQKVPKSEISKSKVKIKFAAPINLGSLNWPKLGEVDSPPPENGSASALEEKPTHKLVPSSLFRSRLKTLKK